MENLGAELLLLHVEEVSSIETDVIASSSFNSDSVIEGEENKPSKKVPLDSSWPESLPVEDATTTGKKNYWDYGFIDERSRNVLEVRQYAAETASEPEPTSDRNPTGPLARILVDLAETPPGQLLLLAKSDGEWAYPITVAKVHDEALRSVDTATDAERTRLQTAQTTFPLYGRGAGGTGREGWRRLAVLTTRSMRTLDYGSEWKTRVRIVESHGALGRWTRARARPSEWEGGRTMLGASAALLALLTGVVLAVRWRAVRTLGGRGRNDVVLLPADFSFPVDELRCVGDGMETMLSCWLQQLHEFGGPELDRPDLLKWPAGGPLAPSAPSSTCSVNRVPLDRRTRYKVRSLTASEPSFSEYRANLNCIIFIATGGRRISEAFTDDE